MVCESRRACWRHAVGTVNAAEIEVRDEQGQRVPEIFDLFGISQSQPREPSLEQTNAKVGSFVCRLLSSTYIALLPF